MTPIDMTPADMTSAGIAAATDAEAAGHAEIHAGTLTLDTHVDIPWPNTPDPRGETQRNTNRRTRLAERTPPTQTRASSVRAASTAPGSSKSPPNNTRISHGPTSHAAPAPTIPTAVTRPSGAASDRGPRARRWTK